MKELFDSIHMGHTETRNRLIRSATHEGFADQAGNIADEGYRIYEELAKGGIGAIITAFTTASINDISIEGIMRLHDDSLIPQLRKLSDVIHKEGCPVFLQIGMGAFFRPTSEGLLMLTPDAMTEAEIQEAIHQIIDSAVRAGKAGFDGVQIHGAHFMFLSRFISPALNHRKDAYGGTTENRCRILLEILQGIRSEAPTLSVMAKINSHDFVRGGIDRNECIAVCSLLDEWGIDALEISGNGNIVGGIKAHINEGYFAETTALVAKEVNCPVSVVGGFRSRDKMETVLNSSGIEMISLCRPLMREPDFPNQLKANLTTESKCISCNQCCGAMPYECVFRS